MKFPSPKLLVRSHRRPIKASRTCAGSEAGKRIETPKGSERAAGPAESAKAQGTHSKVARRSFRRGPRAAVVATTPAARLLLLSLISLVNPAAAQQQIILTLTCGDRDAMTENLRLKYSEGQIGLGIGSSGALYEVWVSPDGETFTLLRTTIDQRSCILGAGDSWVGQLPIPSMEGNPL